MLLYFMQYTYHCIEAVVHTYVCMYVYMCVFNCQVYYRYYSPLKDGTNTLWIVSDLLDVCNII